LEEDVEMELFSLGGLEMMGD